MGSRVAWPGRAGEERGRRSAGELAEVADEVGLVGVADVGRDAVPARRPAVVQTTPNLLEADQPGRGGCSPVPRISAGKSNPFNTAPRTGRTVRKVRSRHPALAALIHEEK